MLASSICTGACSRAGAWLQAQRTAAARQRRDMGPPSGEFPLADGGASVKCFDCSPWLLASQLAVGEVVLDLEQGRALVLDGRLIMLGGARRVLERDPEMGRGEPARFQVRVGVAVFEERLLLDVAEQVPRDGAGPDAPDLGFPGLGEKARAAQDEPLVAHARAGVDQEGRRLEAAGRPLVSRVEGGDPALDGRLALAGEPTRRAGQLEQRAAPGGVGRLFEDARRLGPALQFQEREAAPEGVTVIGRLLEAALFHKLAVVVHRPKMCRGATRGTGGAARCHPPNSGRRCLSCTDRLFPAGMPLARLREVPWDALRADLAVPAIRPVLAGEAAEREVDRTLRARRGLAREERTTLAEAIFGGAS